MNSEINDCVVGLTKDPFDHQLRNRYVELLIENGLLQDAVEQMQLLIKFDGENSKYLQILDALNTQIADKNNPASIIPLKSKSTVTGKTVSDSSVKDWSNVVSISSTGKVRFSDIAGMEEVKRNVRRRIIDPFINPGLFNRYKRKSGGGVLLYGPPGCGKTMIAKAIANECKASFIAVGISEILNIYIGASEGNLASIFEKARAEKPAVLFFDELDALAYSRSKANSDYTRTLVNEFLSQLDGVSGDNEGILILGATNMPWDVDDAMKRSGRFERQIFIPPPDTKAKIEMLKVKLIDVPCEVQDFEFVAKQCNFYSGADIDELIQRAKDLALDDMIDSDMERDLSMHDFKIALDEMNPSTLDWLKTARNLVKFGNAGGSYRDVDKYIKSIKLF